MKLGRSIITTLYLLMMVVLPHAHLVSHAHECDTDHSTGPRQQEHHSCSLCQLLTLPAQTTKSEIAVVASFLSAEILPETPQIYEGITSLPQRARAPPFTTA